MCNITFQFYLTMDKNKISIQAIEKNSKLPMLLKKIYVLIKL